MRRNLLLLVGWVLVLPGFSQDWAPINSTEKFCYTADEDYEIINNVLWVDSTEQMSDHTIYYFNKIVALCDTCSDTTYMLMDQPQFLLDHARVYDNGEWVFESSDQQFKILTNAQLNDEWLFDEENGITAEITALDHMDVIGEPDSIKIVHLSNDHSFTLTKNHGILQWFSPSLELIGIEGRDVGVIVPTFRNMYQNWSEGDVICYHSSVIIADEAVEQDDRFLKYTILDVVHSEDSIVIETSFLMRREYSTLNWSDISYDQGFTSLVFYPDILTEAYPNELVTDPRVFFNICPGGDSLIMKLDHHEWGGIKKSVLYVENDVTDISSIFTQVQEDVLAPVVWGSTWSSNWYNLPEYSDQFTFYESELYGFEWSFEYEVVGLIDDGDTLGIIYEDDVLLGTDNLTSNSDWLIYPNPTKDHISLHSSQTGNIVYQIYSYSGVFIGEQIISKTDDEVYIPVSQLSSGVYLIKLIQNDQTEVLKFMKE